MLKQCFYCVFLLIFQNISSQINTLEYTVYNYGAKGDGVTNNQEAIQKAISACSKTGGTVILKNGTFSTDQLKLVTNLVLKIDSSATILGIRFDEEKDYPHHLIETKHPNRMLQDCQRRLLYGNNLTNVTITGGDTTSGQGDYEPCKHVKELGTKKDRPSILAFVGSKNIIISNIKLIKPACWTQVYIASKNIIIKNIKVNTSNLTTNRDGI